MFWCKKFRTVAAEYGPWFKWWIPPAARVPLNNLDSNHSSNNSGIIIGNVLKISAIPLVPWLKIGLSKFFIEIASVKPIFWILGGVIL